MSTLGWILLNSVDGMCGGSHPCSLHFNPMAGTGYIGTVLLIAGASGFIACLIGFFAILAYYLLRAPKG
ncbi:MAG TPA: hypothetical protein VGP88_03720 [Thermoplasmata archaeon]|nr:hypothetical protein [Thermoplasmata archaeon]